MKNYLTSIYFFTLGAVSIWGQSVILREFTALFYGNELTYCLALSFWLLFTGIGSLYAYKLNINKRKWKLVFCLPLFLFLFLPLIIIFLRFLTASLIPAGFLPDFTFTFFVLGLFLFGYCFFIGLSFTWGILTLTKKNDSQAVNYSYLWETLGFVFGSIFFSFLLAQTTFPLTASNNNQSLKWRYKDLIDSFNSKYNQVILTKKDQQLNFYLSGQLSFTSGEHLENKYFLTLIKPYLKMQKKVLIFGNYYLAHEVKKQFSFDKVDLVEIDNQLLKLEKPFVSSEINLIYEDIRRLFTNSKDRWDLIVFSPGNPQTILTNRLFTQECFNAVKQHLTDNGIFVLSFYIPTDYQSQESILFASSIYQAVKKTFPNFVLFTPEDQVIILTGKNILEIDQTKIDTPNENYFWYQVNNPKNSEIEYKLQSHNQVNSDLEPVGFFYHQLFWQAMYNTKIPKLILRLTGLSPVILLILLSLLLFKSNKKTRLGIITVCSSFVLMSLEILIIIIFQAKIGYLYSQIALIFAAVLAGMAFGVAIINSSLKQFINLQSAILFYLLILLSLLVLINSSLAESSIFLFALAFADGIAGGAIYALINNLYYQQEKNPGFVYAFDLFGGFMGSILTTILIFPYFGLKGLIMLLLSILIINLLFIPKHRQ